MGFEFKARKCCREFLAGRNNCNNLQRLAGSGQAPRFFVFGLKSGSEFNRPRQLPICLYNVASYFLEAE
jgi:hypothetical protein